MTLDEDRAAVAKALKGLLQIETIPTPFHLPTLEAMAKAIGASPAQTTGVYIHQGARDRAHAKVRQLIELTTDGGDPLAKIAVLSDAVMLIEAWLRAVTPDRR